MVSIDLCLGDCSNFAIIGKCKSKWNKAKKLLDREIQAYRNAAVKIVPVISLSASTATAQSAPAVTVNAATVVPTGAQPAPPTSANNVQVQAISTSVASAPAPTEVLNMNASPSKPITTVMTPAISTPPQPQTLPALVSSCI